MLLICFGPVWSFLVIQNTVYSRLYNPLIPDCPFIITQLLLIHHVKHRLPNPPNYSTTNFVRCTSSYASAQSFPAHSYSTQCVFRSSKNTQFAAVCITDMLSIHALLLINEVTAYKLAKCGSGMLAVGTLLRAPHLRAARHQQNIPTVATLVAITPALDIDGNKMVTKGPLTGCGHSILSYP